MGGDPLHVVRHLADHGESAAIASYTDDGKHGWNHQQCYPCWFHKWGLTREPVRFKHGSTPQPCCFCGRPTASGIFIRARPGSGEIPHCPDPGIDMAVFWGHEAPARNPTPPRDAPDSDA